MKAWWASRTPEQLEAHIKKLLDGYKTWRENLTPEQLEALSKKLSDAAKKRHANMTPDERLAISKKQSNTMKKRYENMTPVERAADSKKTSDAWKKRPPTPPIRDPFFFYKEEMLAKMPHIHHTTLTAMIKKQWKDLDPKKKQLYQDKVDQLVAKYEEELIQYNQRNQ